MAIYIIAYFAGGGSTFYWHGWDEEGTILWTPYRHRAGTVHGMDGLNRVLAELPTPSGWTRQWEQVA